ncbi:MAG: methylenetetrahydrofolate dehydrogenase [Anaerolineaceae bacterium 4572_78]|nr:MAG: methylenetetrahydrofolate dehydrogenase [Anaerolineaceae bacterium 4572_78]
MKKLLFQLDTDYIPNTFDTVVAYDGGADHVISLGGVTPENVTQLVEGAIYTRSAKQKKNTALLVSGSNLVASVAVFNAIQKQFFSKFRVSVMLDSNGCNTTASAAVLQINKADSLEGKRAIVLGGTGPVGQRIAVLLAREGAIVHISSRKLERSQEICQTIKEQFDVEIIPKVAFSDASMQAALYGMNIVFGTSKSGIRLLELHHWQSHPAIKYMLDLSTQPPLGFDGIKLLDKGAERHGKLIWGGLGIGAFKLKLHRACIAHLFTSNDQILDIDEIYRISKEMTL